MPRPKDFHAALRVDAPTFRPQGPRKGKHGGEKSASSPRQIQRANKSANSRQIPPKLARVDSGSRHSKGVRSTRADHLLNFSAPAIERSQDMPLSWVPRKTVAKSYRERMEDVKKFLNSRFRFVLSAPEEEGSDLWNRVAFVSYLANSETECSICLEGLVAPQVTKCGHMYCLSCLMRYYHTVADSHWVRCPVCFHSIDRREIKPVQLSPQQPVEPGTKCNFHLLKCSHSPPWIPVSLGAEFPATLLDCAHSDAKFSKQVQYTAEQGSVLRESFASQLVEAMSVEEDAAVIDFLQRASQVVAGMWRTPPKPTAKPRDAPEPIKQQTAPPAPAAEPEFELPMIPLELILRRNRKYTSGGEWGGGKDGKQSDGKQSDGKQSDGEGGTADAVSHADAAPGEEQEMGGGIVVDEVVGPELVPNGDLYFYQLDDGQPVYLLPLNCQMLEHEFGSMVNAPQQIEFQVLEVENYVLTPQMCSEHPLSLIHI
eukprot:TRINITY_DN10669_c0_g1_i7.p1 TRINITY_DN10669_c0_g1~~TRINITY_DN10669_c0_g1_i7.p1  ORF type:complete len:484 (-),score=96.90 TRINITY_DN10669_c0_g1_i7:64-1515(-)